MDNNLLIIIFVVILTSLIIGLFIGWLFAKIIISKKNKKIIKEAKEVIEGKRENFIEIDGVKYPAERFKLRNDDGKEIIIDLKGGKIIKDESKKELKEKQSEIINENNSNIRENSRSFGKEKRDSRTRNGRWRRIRRFG